MLLSATVVEPNHRHNKNGKKYHTKDNTKAVHNVELKLLLLCLFSYIPKTFAASLAASPCKKRTSLIG